MDSLIGFDLPAFQILLQIDVPTIGACIELPVGDVQYPFSQPFADEAKRVVQTDFFLESLCKRFDLTVLPSFATFQKKWLASRLFHSENDLQTIERNYEKQFRLTKALKRAAKVGRFDFVDQILNTKRLWCSMRHVRAVCRGCCWSKDKVYHYCRRFRQMHSELLILEDAERDTNCCVSNIEQQSAIRATLKGYTDSGFKMETDLSPIDALVEENWDLWRACMKPMYAPISLPRDCLDHGGTHLFLNPELIPEDIRKQIEFTSLETVLSNTLDYTTIKVKYLRQLGISRAMIPENEEPYFKYSDRVQNLADAQWLHKNDFDIHELRPILDFLSSYEECTNVDPEIMPRFWTRDSQAYFPTGSNETHPERCAEFVIWCLEKRLHLHKDFKRTVQSNFKYVFSLLLCDSEFRQHLVYADWYDPLSIQYFCDHHLDEFAVYTDGKEKLKYILGKRVEGDELMEEYVEKL